MNMNIVYLFSKFIDLSVFGFQSLHVSPFAKPCVHDAAYQLLKQQIEDLSTQIEAVKKKFGSVEKEK